MLARFVVADLRSSWRQWLGAFIVLSTAGAALMCATLVGGTAGTLPRQGPFPLTSSLSTMAGMNAGIVAVVGLVMVRNVVDQLIAQRRRSMASWMIVGLLPRQVAFVVAGQGLLVAACAAVASAPLGIAAAGLAFVALAGMADAPVPDLVVSAPAVLAPMVLLLVVTVIALVRPCRRAARVDPASALRDDLDVEARRLSISRVIVALGCTVGSGFGVAAAASTGKVAAAGGAVLGVIGAAALLLSALGPVLAVGVHRLWTALAPERLIAWRLARSALLHSPQRVTSVSVPVALVALLPGGFQLLGNSMVASEIASTGHSAASGASLPSLLMVCLLPSVVALVGAAMALFMAGQRRDGELAATALVGATTPTQVRQVTAEALSVVVTGVLLGGGAVAAVALAVRQLLIPLFPVQVLAWPVSAFGLSILLATGIALIASVAPTLPMMRRPPHRAQLAMDR